MKATMKILVVVVVAGAAACDSKSETPVAEPASNGATSMPATAGAVVDDEATRLVDELEKEIDADAAAED